MNGARARVLLTWLLIAVTVLLIVELVYLAVDLFT